MRNVLLIIAIFLISAMAAEGDQAEEKELYRYAVRFRALAMRYAPLAQLEIPDSVLRRISIKIEPLYVEGLPHAEGSCQVSERNDPVIVLNQGGWKVYGEFSREIVIFHELGHCILHREHDDRTIERNGETIPISIMNAHVLDVNDYLLNRDYYLQELFQNFLRVPDLRSTKWMR